VIPEHPAARLFPDMGAVEYYELKVDIEANGLKVPVLLWNGQLIDGRHRLKACNELGIEPRFETTDCSEEALSGLVCSLNKHRRQLTASQRAAIGGLMSEFSKEGKPRLSNTYTAPNDAVNAGSVVLPSLTAHDCAVSDAERIAQNCAGLAAQAQAAKRAGVSRRHVQSFLAVKREDPMLAKRIHDGKITVGKAMRIIEECKNPPVDPPHDFQNMRHREFLDEALRAGERYSERVETVIRISADGVGLMSRTPIDEVCTERERQLREQCISIGALAPKLRAARVIVGQTIQKALVVTQAVISAG